MTRSELKYRTAPFAPWPVFEPEVVEAASRVLASGKVNYWTGGQGKAFEREFAALTERRFAVAVANGTVALELLLVAHGIGDGDEVIVTPRTFIASASACVVRGARPVLADVDRDSGNITAETIARVLTPRTRAVICVHLGGWPCDMDPIMALAAEHDFIVIEDCAQAHLSYYKGRPTGSLGHSAAFSFCQDKQMTTAGEGGMVVMDDEALFKRSWSYKDHGKGYDAVFNTEHPPGFRWLHESFGTNWRLTEVQSAIGRLFLKKLPGWIETRRAHAGLLNERLGALEGLRVPIAPAIMSHSYYKFYAFVRPERLKPGWDRDRVQEAIVAQGIPCYQGSCSEIYREKAFTRSDFGPDQPLPVARELGLNSLMFLVHPTLEHSDIEDTAHVVESVMAQATA